MPIFGPSSGSPSDTPDSFVDAAPLADLPAGAQLSFYIGLRRVLLCRIDDDIYAVKDICPHALQPLYGSPVQGTSIRCAKHGACFNLKTGSPENGVTRSRLETYAVRVRDGMVQVDVNAPISAVAGACKT